MSFNFPTPAMTLPSPRYPAQPSATARSARVVSRRSLSRRNWFERGMAIVILINLGLVAFDYSYIPWRDFYLRQFPGFTQWYGQQFKGIEPHRSTEAYLATVRQLSDQVAADGLQSAAAQATLSQLQVMSEDLIDENPFAAVNKSGSLERIKRRMREQVKLPENLPSRAAFNTFWSIDYLRSVGWEAAIGFFNQDIALLLSSNYYRQIGLNGEPIDRFWRIDLGFTLLFGLEYLARTLYLSRRYARTSWLDTMIWRWYDLLLLLPFWRWLRVIPASIRLNQSRLLPSQPLVDRVVHSLLANVAIEITEVVVIRLIDQLQAVIQQGDLLRWLLQPNRRYIDLNGINEGEVLADRLTQLLVYRVLPKIRPELEALLNHSVMRILQSSIAYQRLQWLPGMSDLSQQLTQQLIAELSQNSYQALTASLEDQAGKQLIQQLIQRFGTTLQTELSQEQSLGEMQTLIVAWLDEVKLNYVDRLAAEDPDSAKTSTARLYELTKATRPSP